MTRRESEEGYTAVVLALMLGVLVLISAFAVDVANWYYTGEKLQRAADSAALAGVTRLPGDPNAAFSRARDYSKVNGYAVGGPDNTQVTTSIDGAPTRLRVKVTTSVQNLLAPVFGIDRTLVSREAVADYAAPISMGSPCNTFGNDPDKTGAVRAPACDQVTGQMWANVNGPSTNKADGDAYQGATCWSGVSGCSGSTNTDYNSDGYYYTVQVDAPGSYSLDLFDPVWVRVGNKCDNGYLASSGATNARNDHLTKEAVAHGVAVSTEASSRYGSGNANKYCTGDDDYSGSSYPTPLRTQFTLRAPSASAWDPLSGAVLCQKTFKGYSGNVYNVLNKTGAYYDDEVAKYFRRWSSFCTFSSPGTYTLQVKTNGLGADAAIGGNRFSMRVTGGDLSKVAIAGRERMGAFTNKPGALNEFYIARVPSGAAGQVLNIKLFDIADAQDSYGNYINTKLTVNKPPDATGTIGGCIGDGPSSGPLSGCSFTGSYYTHNGKWQTVRVPLPTNYSCNDTDPTACWFRLKVDYGASTTSQPYDVTSWTAVLEGNPVRLVE